MKYIEPLEQRLQFASDVIDQTFGVSSQASVDMTVPLGADWHLTSRSFALDAGGRVYGLAALEKRSDQGKALDYKLAITRLSRDGQFDPTFGESGYKLLDRPLVEDGHPTNQLTIGVDSNNRAFVADGPLLWRLTPGGRADMTFGRRGKIVIPVLNTGVSPYPTPLVFDSGGRPYLGGTSQGKTGTRMTVIRLTEEGGIDFTWWNGAYKSPVHATSTTSTSTVSMLQFQPDGKLLIVGEFGASYNDGGAPDGNGPHFALSGAWVARLNADSTVDTTYGSNGYAEEAYKSQDVQWGIPRPLKINADGSVFGWTRRETDWRGPEAFSTWEWTIAADGKAVSEQPPKQGTSPPFVPVDATAFDGSRIAVDTGPEDNPIQFTRYFRDDAPLAVYDGRNVRAARTTSLRFVVTYRDDDNVVKLSSLDSRDIQVFGPFDGGEPRNKYAALESVQTLSDGRLMAIYHIASPGGWTRADNGLYTVNLRGGQVEDINGVAAPASTLGTFRVRIS